MMEELFESIAACDRTLWSPGRRSPRERLTALLESGYDLEAGAGADLMRQLETRVAGLLGMPAAAFFPTGTMAQQVALRCWAERTGSTTVAMHALAHPLVYERDALIYLTGLRAVTVASAPRPVTEQDVRALDEPFGTLMIELPLRDAGFLLPAWDELTATVAAARERDAIVHFDGARLWESAPHLGRDLDEIAALADSVYVSFYKSLGAMSGAALAGPEDFVAQAKAWRHRYGGQVPGQLPFALDALLGLDTELPRLPSYVTHAAVAAAAMGAAFADTLPWSRVAPVPPHTHQFAVWLPYAPNALLNAALRQAEETRTSVFTFWKETAVAGISMTEVTVGGAALSWTAADIEAAVRDFLSFLPDRA